MERWNLIKSKVPKSKDIVGAEVGVWRGEMSKNLLSAMPRLTLYMIDRWKPHKVKGSNYECDSMLSASMGEHKKALSEVRQTADRFGKRAIIMQGESSDCAVKFENEFFDFVFIDAEHSYEQVSNDIRFWYPKVKPGGWLCGHDYNHHRYGRFVMLAIKDFSEPLRLTPEFLSDKSWFVQKPCAITS